MSAMGSHVDKRRETRVRKRGKERRNKMDETKRGELEVHRVSKLSLYCAALRILLEIGIQN